MTMCNEDGAKISVIIPAYNYAGFIEEAMGSVLSQMIDGDELLVVDDGSTDDTEEVVSAFISRARSGSITYHKKLNGGAASARNYGVHRASCEYIVLLDADDRMLAGGLQTLRKAVADNESADLFVASYNSKHSSGKVVSKPATPLTNSGEKNFNLFLNKKIRISHGGFLVKKGLLKKTPYPEDMRCLEDQSVFAHLLALASSVSVDACVVERYHHDNSLRNDVSALLDASEKVVGAVFDENIIPQSYMKYKKAYSVNRYLSAFRRLYDQAMYKESLGYFRKALRIDARSVLHIKYIKRAFKAFFMKSFKN